MAQKERAHAILVMSQSEQDWIILIFFFLEGVRIRVMLEGNVNTVLIRLQADLGYKPRPQTSHAKN